MGRQARTDLRTKPARMRLAVRSAPHYAQITDDLHIGYRRVKDGAGAWIVRTRKPEGGYREQRLALADDVRAADGVTILTHDQAADRAREGAGMPVARVTVIAAAMDWADGKANASRTAKSRRGYYNDANRITEALGADTLIAEVTVGQIESWRDARLSGARDDDGRRKRRATANRELATLKAILTKAADRAAMTDRPWTLVTKFPKVESHGRRMIILTGDERKRFTEACDEALRPFVTALFLTGARPGEIADARVKDLDLPVMKLTGKTGTRSIRLPAAAAGWFATQAQGINDQDRYIFRTKNGEHWTKDRYRQPVKRAVAAAGLAPETTLYAVRHTTISKWVSNGAPIAAVALHTGTSVNQIMSSYFKSLPEQADRWFQ
jgi:integrase